MRTELTVESGINFAQWGCGAVTKQFLRVISPLWVLVSSKHALLCHEIHLVVYYVSQLQNKHLAFPCQPIRRY
jgi:hypothetical protein